MLTSSLRYNITSRVRRAVTKINPAQFKSKVIRRVSPPLASGCQTVGDGAELFCNGLQIFSCSIRAPLEWRITGRAGRMDGMRRPAGAGEDPPHRLFPLQVEVERHGTQRRIEKELS